VRQTGADGLSDDLPRLEHVAFMAALRCQAVKPLFEAAQPPLKPRSKPALLFLMEAARGPRI